MASPRTTASDMSDAGDKPKTTPAKTAEIDSDAVDYDESDDDAKPQSGSDEDSSGDSDTAIKRKDLPVIRPFNRRGARQAPKQSKNTKAKPLNPRGRRRQEAKTKAFLMKTMDNTHVRLVKHLVTSYDIFTFICEKYEGAAFHGDPYFIQHYLMEMKYEEGSNLTEFFLKLENTMKAVSEATESVMTEGQKSIYLFHSMPKSWKDDLHIWKGRRKYIPYEDLKQSIEGKMRDLQAQERYALAKGTPETAATKRERALVAAGPTSTLTDHGNSYNNTCSYCDHPRHAIRHCRSLQKDLRTGHVKAGTVLPANFVFKSNSKREYPKNKGKTKRNGNSAGGNYNGNRGKNRQRQNCQESSDDDDYRRSKSRERKRRQDGSDDAGEAGGNRRKVFRQERRESGLIAVATAINPPLSLTAQANVDLDTTWTNDSGCTRHVTHEAQWFSSISASGHSITVGGKNQIPIEGTGRVELEVIDSKGNMKTLILHGVLYAPQLHFSLLSVSAAVKHDFRFSFDRKKCAMQTDERFSIKAPMATNTDLYQFQAKPAVNASALIATSGAKPSVDSMALRL